MTDDRVTPKTLTPAEQNLADEATVFILAGCMLSILSSFQDKDHEKTAELIGGAAEVVNSDPHFPKRFYAAQTAIMTEFNRKRKASKIIRLHQ